MRIEKSFKPIAIVAVGFIVAAIIFLAGSPISFSQSVSRGKDAYVYGEKNAPIRIVEFSDLQCPFCARVHKTLESVVAKSEGMVAWEYRHFPLASHPRALPAARYAECIGVYKGENVFFEYLGILFEAQQNLTDAALLTRALAFGVTEEEMTSCIARPDIESQIQEDADMAVSLGGQGTPFSVVVYPDDSTEVVRGALPEEHWISLIEKWEKSVQ